MNNLNDIFFAPAANQDLTYDQVLEDVQRYFAENHASTIAEAGEGNAERATTLLKELMVQYIVKRKYAIEGLTTEELCEKLYEDMAGYSFLKKWIYILLFRYSGRKIPVLASGPVEADCRIPSGSVLLTAQRA